MNLNLTGNHLNITPAIRDYVLAKLERVNRHFDHVLADKLDRQVIKHKEKRNGVRYDGALIKRDGAAQGPQEPEAPENESAG